MDTRLRGLAELPVTMPTDLATRAWAEGRRQHRRGVRLALSAAVLTVGVATGIIATAHPAVAASETTAAAYRSPESVAASPSSVNHGIVALPRHATA